MCAFCKTKEKDIIHALIFCPIIRYCWNVFLPCLQAGNQHNNFFELAMWMRNHRKMDELTSFFIIAWSLWGRRNKWIFEKLLVDPKTTIEQGLSTQALFTECHDHLD